MAKWKYSSELVQVGENSVNVRQLTAKQRTTFATYSADGKQPAELPFLVVQLGNADNLTNDEIDEMPPELLDAAWHKILELTGLRVKDDGTASLAAGDDGEKKAG
jgi:hypothetical protein